MWLVATDWDSTDKEQSILAEVLGSSDEQPTEESASKRGKVSKTSKSLED